MTYNVFGGTLNLAQSILTRSKTDAPGREAFCIIQHVSNPSLLFDNIALQSCVDADAGLRIRIFNLAIKLISCILYVVRVMLEDAAREDDEAGSTV